VAAVLQVLGDGQQRSLSELVQQSGLTKSAVIGALNQLEMQYKVHTQRKYDGKRLRTRIGRSFHELRV
jgi:DNA-binding IclR family transcriptional regulator